MHVVTLVTKEGCTLCDKVLRLLQSSPTKRSYELKVAYLKDEPDLERRYLLRIPVVLVDDVEAFEAKEMDPGGRWGSRLESMLARLGST